MPLPECPQYRSGGCGFRYHPPAHPHMVAPVTKVSPSAPPVGGDPPVTKVPGTSRMGRPRRYRDNAEKQAAYRARKSGAGDV